MSPEIILLGLAIVWALCIACLVESIRTGKRVKAKADEMDDTENFYHT